MAEEFMRAAHKEGRRIGIGVIAITLFLIGLIALVSGLTRVDDAHATVNFQCEPYAPLSPRGGSVRTVNNSSELSSALSAAVAGDVINLNTGTYGRIQYQQSLGHANGTANAPIVIQAGAGQSPVVDGGGFNNHGAVDVTRRNHIYVRGLEVKGDTFGIRFQNVNGGGIEHNHVHDVGDAGIPVQSYWADNSASSSNIVVQCNRIHDTGRAQPGFGEGIYIGHGSGLNDDTNNIQIQKNEIYNTPADAIDVKAPTRNITISDNYIHDLNFHIDSFGRAIALAGNATNYGDANYRVERNLIGNLSSARADDAIAIVVGHGTTTISNNIIYNIEDRAIVMQRTGSGFGFGNPSAADVNLYNNTLWNCGGSGCLVDLSSGVAKITAANNLADASVTGSDNIVASNGDFVGPLTGTADAGDGPGTGFVLSQNSSAINAGTPIGGESNVDADGSTRSDGQWDVGAIEQSGGGGNDDQGNDQDSGPPAVFSSGSSEIIVRARGSTGTENINLSVNGSAVASWNSIETGFSSYSHTVTNQTVINDIRVNFTNDGSHNGADRNAYIDYIEIDGVRYQSEATTTRSLGSYTDANQCGEGYKQSEALHCNGWLRYEAAQGVILAGEDAEPNVGAVNHHYSLRNSDWVSVDITPTHGEDGYHFYALTARFENHDNGLYAGLQTEGNLGDGDAGNIFIFSVWDAVTAYPENNATSLPFSGEGEGYSLRVPYDWRVGTSYRVSIERGIFDQENNGWRWAAVVTNLDTGQRTRIGEIPAPSGGDLIRGQNAFHERYAGDTPECDGSSSNLERAGAIFSNLGGANPSAFTSSSPNGIFASSTCASQIHYQHGGNWAASGVGISQAQFDDYNIPQNLAADCETNQPLRMSVTSDVAGDFNLWVRSQRQTEGSRLYAKIGGQCQEVDLSNQGSWHWGEASDEYGIAEGAQTVELHLSSGEVWVDKALLTVSDNCEPSDADGSECVLDPIELRIIGIEQDEVLGRDSGRVIFAEAQGVGAAPVVDFSLNGAAAQVAGRVGTSPAFCYAPVIDDACTETNPGDFGEGSHYVVAHVEDQGRGLALRRNFSVGPEDVPPPDNPDDNDDPSDDPGDDDTETTIFVRARGQTGEENMELHINAEPVAQWSSVASEDTTYAHTVTTDTIIETLEVHFTNDLWTGPDFDRNLYVDYIEIDGTRYQTEAGDTYSVGSSGCGEGYAESEMLFCDGWFRYEAVLGLRLAAPEGTTTPPDGGSGSGVTSRIEAEAFTAYNDSSSERDDTTSECRTDAMPVDTFEFADTDGIGGCAIGGIEDGEWLEWNVNASAAGEYTLALRHANGLGSPSAVDFRANGQLQVDDAPLVATNGWVAFTTENVGTLSLDQGNNVIRFEHVNAFNFDYMTLTGPGTVTVPNSSPDDPGDIVLPPEEGDGPIGIDPVSIVNIRARGDTGTERIQLRINNVKLATWKNISPEMTTYSHAITDPTTIDKIRVHFNNDLYEPPVDRNVQVDYIEIDGVRYESEDETVRSKGTWSEATQCRKGFKQSEILFCNGWLEYREAQGLQLASQSQVLGTTTVGAGGQGGDSIVYAHGGTHTATEDEHDIYRGEAAGHRAASSRIVNSDNLPVVIVDPLSPPETNLDGDVLVTVPERYRANGDATITYTLDGAELASVPASISAVRVKTSGFDNGSYVLGATVRDRAGAVDEISIPVELDNTPLTALRHWLAANPALATIFLLLGIAAAYIGTRRLIDIARERNYAVNVIAETGVETDEAIKAPPPEQYVSRQAVASLASVALFGIVGIALAAPAITGEVAYSGNASITMEPENISIENPYETGTDTSGAAPVEYIRMAVGPNGNPDDNPDDGGPVTSSIEAENFTRYSDGTPGNNGDGTCRPDAPDADLKASGSGCTVGWFDAGDWMEWGINASQMGSYTVRFVYANGHTSNARVEFLVNGQQQITDAQLAPTGAWSALQNGTIGMIDIDSQSSTLRLNQVDSFDIDQIIFEGPGTISINDGGGGDPPPPPPPDDDPVSIRIEAESFSAYNENTPGNDGNGTCRPDAPDVDMKTVGSDCTVGWIDSGEWLEWDVSVPQSGSYVLAIQYANGLGTDALLDFSVNGQCQIRNTIAAPTSDWNTLASANIGTLDLVAGSNTVRFNQVSSIDLDYLTLVGPTAGDIVGCDDGGGGPGDPPPPPSSVNTIIEAESFTDYSDSSPGNNGNGTCRPDAPNADLKASGSGCTVGWLDPGDWMEWVVDASEPGTYSLDLVYANGQATNTHVRFLVDGQEQINNSSLPPTGGWATLSTANAGNLTLSEGTNVIRFNQAAFIDIDQLIFNGPGTLVLDGGGGDPPPPPPDDPVAIRVEAESFSAFNENSPGNNGDGTCRPDAPDVDLKASGSGCTVGWIDSGEWLEWDISVPQTGDYVLAIRYANGLSVDTLLDFSVDGECQIRNTVAAPTSDWNTLASANIGTLNLTAGSNTVRFNQVSSIDLDYLTLVGPTAGDIVGCDDGGGPGDPPPPPPPVSDDYDSNLAVIRAQTYRNRTEDNSPFRNTPMAQIPISSLYGPRSEYLGNPAGNPEQSFPVPNGGQFRTACEFSHFAYDDPLVFPNQPGKSHLHMFFGNTDVNAYSTYNTLFNSGGATCNGQELNRTGYWVPAMFDDRGNVRIPERIVVYYKGEGLARGNSQAYPAQAAFLVNYNINAIGGGSGGAAGQFSFKCSDQYSGANNPVGNTMVACDGNRFLNIGDPFSRVVLEMNIKFPQCWNGSNPADFRNNYRIPTQGSWYFSLCDGAFNRTLPNMEYFVNYPVEHGENTANWFLSSDVNPVTLQRDVTSGASIHGDWWGAWNPTINQTWINNCVNFTTHPTPSGCGFGYLTNGGPNGGAPFDGPALKYREQWTGPNKVPAQQIYNELCTNPTRSYTTPQSAAWCRP